MLSNQFLKQLDIDKKSFIDILENSIIAVVIFLLSSIFIKYDLVRSEINDYGYDIAMKGYSLIPFNSNKTGNIITILIDEKYLNENNLSDKNGGLRYNYTPRYIIADILNNLDFLMDERYPKAVFLDYAFKYSGSIDGKITQDDKKLIHALNKYSKHYPIYLPTTTSKMFLEEQNLSKNIHFVSTKMFNYSDGIQRGLEPYICKNGKTIKNIFSTFINDINYKDKNCSSKDESYSKYFNYRILYKKIDKNYQSKYKNIKIYSATTIDNIGPKLDEDFSNNIILIGSNYKNSNDIHNTPIGSMSGILIIANGIMSSLITQNNFHALSVTKSSFLYFFIFLSISLLSNKILAMMNVQNNTIIYYITLIFNVLFLYILSVVSIIYFNTWLNWVIPLLAFEIIDGKPLLKKPIIYIFSTILKILKELFCKLTPTLDNNKLL